MLKTIAAAVLSLSVVACASAGTGATTSQGFSELITPEEVASVEVATALQLVQRLRPGWLRGRGSTSIVGGEELPVVYVDDVRSGAIQTLDDLAAGIVHQVSFISGRDAAVRYGLNHGAGVIMVETGRER